MNISQELSERLFYLTKLLHHSGHQGSRGYAQDRALRAIAAQEGISQRDLMERLDVRPSSMSELLTKLENGGLIERRPNPGDRRQIQLYLSQEGRFQAALLGEDDPRPDPFAALTDDEKRQYLAMTDRVIETLGDRGGDFHQRPRAGRGGRRAQDGDFRGERQRPGAMDGGQTEARFCNGCGKGCKLTHPGCGHGARLARERGIAPKI